MTASEVGAVPDDVIEEVAFARALTADPGVAAELAEVKRELDAGRLIEPAVDATDFHDRYRGEAVAASDDDLTLAVAEALHAADRWPSPWQSATLGSYTREKYLALATAALSVPSVAEVFARDAKVREIVGMLPHGATDSQMVALAEDVLAAVRLGGEL